MNETARKRLRDARDACQRIEFQVIGPDEEIYVQTTTPTYAVNWLLMVLGKALNAALRDRRGNPRCPGGHRALKPDRPWLRFGR